MNICVVRGRLSSPAQLRTLESGDSLVSLNITVPAEPKAESVPVVWFQAPAWSADLDVGDELVVVGRVRRRFFSAGASTQSRTEIVAEKVVKASRAKRVAAVLDDVLGQLDDALHPVAAAS